MPNQTCENCRHFVQHYVKDRRSKFVPIYEGRCGHPQLKARKTDTPACERFSARKSNT
ncbi:hypothetical protein C816_02199 [Oscillibacter sp. 1-3]|nr:hypothetical protein C816_02199 [Oscillibacter sp. 1-3]